MRGIHFVQMPTTLLSAVDTSVGGKTAIDLLHGKNLAGAFWQPDCVICDTGILRDLPERRFADGMGEVIKHGVIAGADVLESIARDTEKNDLEWLIARNVEIKRDVVEQDEHESGNRRILNFGHTVAHAIEKNSGYQIPHGTAVGTGMVYEARLAERLRICRAGLSEEIMRYCKKYGIYIKQTIDDQMIHIMLLDKKNFDDQIVFVLPGMEGECVIAKLSPQETSVYLR